MNPALRTASTGMAAQQTGRSLDVAIDGDGLFPLQLPGGQQAYTRDGSFQISDQGVLVTSDGYQVGAGIKVPNDVTEIAISATGVVSGSKGAGGEATELGRIELARFA